jgi:hypothetical protein
MGERQVGRYVYCVTEVRDGLPLEGLEGVDAAFGVEAVDGPGLCAVVSTVSLEQFGAEALKRNLEDLEWLERVARAHHAVLDRVAAAAPLVPLRLCVIFEGDDHVRAMLERERDGLVRGLERVRGRAEWSVKVIVDRAALEAAARERSPALATRAAEAEEAPGRAYFARKKIDRQLRDEAREIADGAVQDVHARLTDEATAATLLPPPHPDLVPESGPVAMNGAYLVERGREAEFAAAVAELGERYRDLGLELRLGGPWAPYNFVTSPDAS